MKIILLQEIKGLGKQFDVKEVKEGYARNFLFPKKLAKIATENEIKDLARKKEALQKQREKIKHIISEEAKKLAGTEFHFYPKTGKNDEVFGSVAKTEIEEEVARKLPPGIKDKIKIHADTKSIKTLGEHLVEIDFGSGIRTEIKVILNQTNL